jgi:hypothetical protein
VSRDLLPPGLVWPRYEGGSVVNLACSVLQKFGAESPWPGLDGDLLPGPLLRQARSVLLLVVDALGRLSLDRALAAGAAPHLASLLGRPGTVSSTLTSVFPSTTAAALTAISTGATPAEHGLLAYTVWFPEADSVADCLTWETRPRGRNVLDRVQPAVVPTVYERLAQAGIPGYIVSNAAFQSSGLGLVLDRGVTDFLGYVTPSSIPPLAVQALAAAGGPAFLFAYWHGLDDVGHRSGPDSPLCAEELRMFDGMLGRLTERLAGTGTLLLLTADHGMIGVDMAHAYAVNGTPVEAELASRLAGDARAPYLRARPGRAEALARVLEETFPGTFDILPARQAMAAGLWGARTSPFLARIGDWVVLPRGNGRIWHNPEVPLAGLPLQLGSHGGLSPEEMLVPLVAALL